MAAPRFKNNLTSLKKISGGWTPKPITQKRKK